MRYKKHKLVYKTYIAQNNNVHKNIFCPPLQKLNVSRGT